MTRLRAMLLALLVGAAAPAPAYAGEVVHRSTAVSDPAGDRDGFAEPGEPFRLSETVFHSGNANPGCAIGGVTDPCRQPGDMRHVDGVVTAPSSAFVFTRPASPYPDLPEGSGVGTNRRAFLGRVVRDALCGRFVTVGLLLAADNGTDTVRFRVPIGAPTPASHLSSPDVPKPIPDDGGPGGNTAAESSLTIASRAPIRDIDVRVDSITHPSDGELELILRTTFDINPRYLASRVGGTGDDFKNTIFDADAPTPIRSGTAPFTGRFLPDSQHELRQLYGRSARGTWTLTVEDLAAGNVGTLDAWGLDIRHSVCSVAPRASFTASRAVAGEPVRFDGSASVGAIVRFDWDLDGNGSFETHRGTAERVAHTYPSARTVSVRLRVTDRDGNQSFYTRAVDVRARAAGSGH